MNSLEFEGMGTTLVIAIIYKNNLYVANVGDSRCYLLNADGFNKITIDHSVVEELVKANMASASYGDPVTVTVHVVNNDYVYEIPEADYTALDDALIDLGDLAE